MRWNAGSSWWSSIAVVLGVAMISINIHGLFIAPYDRPPEAGRVESAISKIATTWNLGGNRAEVLEVATESYAETIVYVWPKHKARVALTDNWILWSMRYFDPVLTALGMTNVEGLFRAYETVDYRRALARGMVFAPRIPLASHPCWNAGTESMRM